MPDDVLRLESFLPYRLSRAAAAVSARFSKLYKARHGLSRAEWRTLATLGQFGRLTATAIGRHSAMHKSKVSRAVAGLERRRWLKRVSNEADRRLEWLDLTAQGRAVYADLVPIALAFERELVAAIPAGAARDFDQTLAALEHAAEQNAI